jgi:hypothetical protein
MHLTWYCKENLKGAMHVSKRNSFRALFKRSEPTLNTYFVKLVHRIVSENSYTSVLVKLPVILLGAFAILQSILAGRDMYSYALAAPTMAACIVYFIVNLRPFLFLGEAERYFNHVAFFISLFTAHYALDNGLEWMLWALFIYGSTYWCIETFALSKLIPIESKKRAIEDEFIIKDLASLSKSSVVLAYPYHAAGGIYRIILETKHRVIFCVCTEKNFSQRFNFEYAEDYPYIKLNKIDDMSDEFNVGYIVLHKKSMYSRGFSNWKPSARWVKRPVGGEIYDVYYRPT